MSPVSEVLEGGTKKAAVIDVDVAKARTIASNLFQCAAEAEELVAKEPVPGTARPTTSTRRRPRSRRLATMPVGQQEQGGVPVPVPVDEPRAMRQR